MAGSKTCPKCNGRMEEGHAIDMGYGSVTASKWQPGAPIKHWWGSIRVDKKALLDIASFRCARCGFLESYAG